MLIEGNVLYAIDDDMSILKTFKEWEDAARYYYNNGKQCRIILRIKGSDTAFNVNEEQLESIYKSIQQN